jgi:hypothetical protein
MTHDNRLVAHLLCLVVASFCAQTAQAQTIQPPTVAGSKQSGVEVTPFIGFGSPTSSRGGGAIAFTLAPKVRVEAEVALHSCSQLSSSVNLLYSLPRIRRVEPYIAAGVGLGQNEIAFQAPSQRLVIQQSVGLVVNAGAGFTVPIREGVGYRFDTRWSMPRGIHPEAWRVYHGVTLGMGGK